MVLPSAYLPPISWFAHLLTGEPISIEQHENYQKQTIRNRCTIDSPNGPLHLTIPIDKSNFATSGNGNINIGMHLRPPTSTPLSLNIFKTISVLFTKRNGTFLWTSTKHLLPNVVSSLTFILPFKERKPIQASHP